MKVHLNLGSLHMMCAQSIRDTWPWEKNNDDDMTLLQCIHGIVLSINIEESSSSSSLPILQDSMVLQGALADTLDVNPYQIDFIQYPNTNGRNQQLRNLQQSANTTTTTATVRIAGRDIKHLVYIIKIQNTNRGGDCFHCFCGYSPKNLVDSVTVHRRLHYFHPFCHKQDKVKVKYSDVDVQGLNWK